MELKINNSRPTVYTPSGPRGGGVCVHCGYQLRKHDGKHEFCPVIVIYEVQK